MDGGEQRMDERGIATALDAEPVPHATPLVTGTTGDTETGEQGSDDELNQQIADSLGEIIVHAHDLGQRIAAQFGLTVSDTKALFLLEAPLTMKELGLRMGCDPSFVTTVADALEKHGLARREPSQRDRRSKNLVLTPEGATLRQRLWAELSAQAPWCTSLDTSERRCLLTLMRKMVRSRGGR
jgi:MarR family transcriptional regulator, organic hydroperoxide resistance regulator